MFLLKVTVFLAVTTQTFSLKDCDVNSSFDISKGTHMSNGDIYYAGVLYEKSDYYYDNVTGQERGCICSKETCVKKCCPFGKAYHFKKKQCIDVSDVFDPPVWNINRKLAGVNASELFQFIFTKPNCTGERETRIRITQLTKVLRLQQDGRLYIEVPHTIPPWALRGPDEYCIDTFVYEDSDGKQTTNLDALVCFGADDKHHHYELTAACMIISCVFILATLGVYGFLPELRNLHGKVLMVYLACLFVGFALFATMQILLVTGRVNVDGCIGLTFGIYFSLLSAFFWLNVMCFDIWWTFSGKRGLSLEKLTAKERFYAYSVYAFSIPILLTVLLMSLELSGLRPNPWLPNIRQNGCFIQGRSKMLYFYGPIVVLCLANTVFFVLTALKIARIKQQTSVLKSKESATHDVHRNDRQRLHLYLKLFAVMGINWILEVTSGAYPDLYQIWIFTDCYNILIGLVIFIIFVCKRKIYRLLKKRYRQMRGETLSRTQTTDSSRHSNSQQDIKMTSLRNSVRNNTQK